MKNTISSTIENTEFKQQNTDLMKQLDYIKIKVQNVGKLNTEYLTDHPTIKNRYKMNFPQGGFNGTTLHGKNIDVYYNKNTLYVSTSIPYLMYGHNFVNLEPQQAKETLEYVSSLLNVDLLSGIVVDFEVGFIYNTKIGFKDICNTITGIDDMELQKKNSSFLAYGNKNIQFKIYNIYKNLKNKVSKPVFDTIVGLRSNTIKIELKFTKDYRYTVKQLFNGAFIVNLMVLYAILQNNLHQLEVNYDGSKFDDVLYKTLLKANKYTYKNVGEMILETIDSLDISYSKKTARRKSLRDKQQLVKLGTTSSFTDLLYQPSCDDLPFLGTFPVNCNSKTVNHV